MEIENNLKSHFLNLYSIALADTKVDTTELETLYEIGEEHGISKDEIEEIILHPTNESPNIPSDTLTKVEYLYDFVKIILADGIVDEREKAALEKFCISFGFEKDNIPAIMEFLIEECKKGTEKKSVIDQVKQTL